AQGRFVLSGVPTGFVDVCAQKEAMLSGRVPGVAVAPRSETRDVSLVLGEIPADSVISGIVLDEEDAPVPHAPLTIRRHSERGVWVNSMTADGQGRFRLEKEVDGPVTIQAAGRRTRKGEGTEHHRSGAAEVEPGTRDLILRLRAPQWIEIAARDEHGDAVPVDSVYIVSRTRSEGGSRTSSSAKLQREEDSVSVSIVCPAVRFGLVIDKVGYETVEIPSMEPGDVGERIEVVLRPLPVLRGVVRTGAAPVEGAVVQLHSVVPENQEFTYAGFPWLWLGVDGHGTMTDAEGRFALPLDFEEIKEGLDFVLHASGERLAPALSRTFRLDGLNHPREIEIEMMPGGSIGGRLLLPDGTSPAGMYVGASNGDGTLQAQRVAADGAFRFDHLMPGNWLVERMESEHGHARGSGGGHLVCGPARADPLVLSCRRGEEDRVRPGFPYSHHRAAHRPAHDRWPRARPMEGLAHAPRASLPVLQRADPRFDVARPRRELRVHGRSSWGIRARDQGRGLGSDHRGAERTPGERRPVGPGGIHERSPVRATRGARGR
ncbi:MAG: carboxypeptidase regulatory-like domain-containing protein, partial [Myxococcota bacterium]|nr:carboxypeptidase regulatory-like domain-containing protein [Myxococcota bacterium]